MMLLAASLAERCQTHGERWVHLMETATSLSKDLHWFMISRRLNISQEEKPPRVGQTGLLWVFSMELLLQVPQGNRDQGLKITVQKPHLCLHLSSLLILCFMLYFECFI